MSAFMGRVGLLELARKLGSMADIGGAAMPLGPDRLGRTASVGPLYAKPLSAGGIADFNDPGDVGEDDNGDVGYAGERGTICGGARNGSGNCCSNISSRYP
jgi:hypothetical protein